MKLTALLALASLFSTLCAACGPPSCSDKCLDECEEKPGSCEPNATLFCLQSCPNDDGSPETMVPR